MLNSQRWLSFFLRQRTTRKSTDFSQELFRFSLDIVRAKYTYMSYSTRLNQAFYCPCGLKFYLSTKIQVSNSCSLPRHFPYTKPFKFPIQCSGYPWLCLDMFQTTHDLIAGFLTAIYVASNSINKYQSVYRIISIS